MRIKRDYTKDYPSVTEVLSILEKPALKYWYINNTAEFIKAEGDRAKEIGTQIHEIIQNHIEKECPEIETNYPDEIKNLINSFFLFKRENPDIELKKSEIKVVSETYKYQGTLDCLSEEKGFTVLCDWKSSKCNVGKKYETEKPVIYDEALYQVSAYVRAYNEQENETIAQARIISFAKDKVAYNTILLDDNQISEYLDEVFLPLLKVKYNIIKHKEDK